LFEKSIHSSEVELEILESDVKKTLKRSLFSFRLFAQILPLNKLSGSDSFDLADLTEV
jgi:hypothetical protein